METKNISDINWVLVGMRPNKEENPTEEMMSTILDDAFKPEATYSLFLCGAEIDKTGTLEELEQGFRMILDGFEEYNEGDYCIIHKHEEADLLFMPVLASDEVETESEITDLD